MCAQLDVLKKIRKKGKVNGYDIDLAEAQARDFMDTKRRLDSIEANTSTMQGSITTMQGSITTMQADIATIKGQMDIVIKYIESPADKEREAGQKWNLLVSITRHKAAWVILILCAISFALAGEKLVSILERLI